MADPSPVGGAPISAENDKCVDSFRYFRKCMKIAVVSFSGLAVIVNLWFLHENGLELNGNRDDEVCEAFKSMLPLNNLVLNFFIILAETNMKMGSCLEAGHDAEGLKNMRSAAGFGILACGFVYTGMGFMCLKRLTRDDDWIDEDVYVEETRSVRKSKSKSTTKNPMADPTGYGSSDTKPAPKQADKMTTGGKDIEAPKASNPDNPFSEGNYAGEGSLWGNK